MIGNLEPEEHVMNDSVMYPGGMLGQLAIALEQMGWESGDDVAVEIAGTSVYEIDGAGTKWAPVKGTRKINKDAFIVIKNRSRNPTISSVNDDPERLQPIPRWKQASNEAIAKNLLVSIGELLDAEVKYYYCCDRTTRHKQIIITYDKETKQ